MSLHDQIMNLPCDVPTTFADEGMVYKLGHRDARHAAAELALSADEQIRKLREALEEACEIIEECGEELGAGPMSGIAAALTKYRAALKEES